MINNEQTQYDEVPRNESVADAPSRKKKSKGGRFAAGVAGAAVAGAGAAFVSGFTTKEDGATMEHASSGEEVPAWSDGEVAVATGDYENMTFSEAFAAARAEVGPGGAFVWHGKVYGTYLHDEWQNMSAAERAEYESHFSWNNHHSAPRDNQAQSEPQADAKQSEDITAEVVSQEDEAPVIEVIGVAHDDDLDANIAVVSVDDNAVLLVDVDNDMHFDVMAADVNGDGQVSEDEVFDIRDSHITVADLGGFTSAQPDPGNMCMYGSPETVYRDMPEVDEDPTWDIDDAADGPVS